MPFVFASEFKAPVPSVAAGSALSEKTIALAVDELHRIENLVNAGALPKVRLEQARENLSDAQDDAILQRTLYGGAPVQSLTEQTAQEMVAAAQRRTERQQKRIADQQKLIDDGVIARNALEPLREELAMRELSLRLAGDRLHLITELAAMAQSERMNAAAAASAALSAPGIVTGMEHFAGTAEWVETRDLRPIEAAFQQRFHKPLPISADGETAIHRSLGFDHRGRVDVAVNPNTAEGQWLISYLKTHRLPFYAFAHAMIGRATGAHIHIGPGSAPLYTAVAD